MEFEQAMQLIEKLLLLIAFFIAYRSVPAGTVRDLLAAAKEGAAKTADKRDDLAVEIATHIAGLLLPKVHEVPKPDDKPMEANIFVKADDPAAIKDAVKDALATKPL